MTTSKIVIGMGMVKIDTDNPDTSYIANLALHLWEATQKGTAREPIGFIGGSTIITELVGDTSDDADEAEDRRAKRR